MIRNSRNQLTVTYKSFSMLFLIIMYAFYALNKEYNETKFTFSLAKNYYSDYKPTTCSTVITVTHTVLHTFINS